MVERDGLQVRVLPGRAEARLCPVAGSVRDMGILLLKAPGTHHFARYRNIADVVILRAETDGIVYSAEVLRRPDLYGGALTWPPSVARAVAASEEPESIALVGNYDEPLYPQWGVHVMRSRGGEEVWVGWAQPGPRLYAVHLGHNVHALLERDVLVGFVVRLSDEDAARIRGVRPRRLPVPQGLLVPPPDASNLRLCGGNPQ